MRKLLDWVMGLFGFYPREFWDRLFEEHANDVCAGCWVKLKDHAGQDHNFFARCGEEDETWKH